MADRSLLPRPLSWRRHTLTRGLPVLSALTLLASAPLPVTGQTLPSLPAAPPAATAIDTEQPVQWTLQIEAPRELRSLLSTHLDLSRYGDALAEGAAPVTRGELARLVTAAPAQARALLETRGHFSADVQAQVDDPQANPVTVRLRVVPGALTRVAEVHIDLAGELASPSPDQTEAARRLAEQVQRDFGLRAGEPFTQDAWSGAKRGLLNRLRAEGYARAVYTDTQADVDAESARVTLTLAVDSGPLLRIGPTRIDGLHRVDRAAIDALQPFSEGMPLREQALQDFQDRLIKTNLFDTVAVTPGEEALQAAAADAGTLAGAQQLLTVPVLVTVRERARNQAVVGVGASDTTGARITVEHLRQDVFGTGWSAKTRVQLGQTERALSLDLLSEPHPGPYRNLLSGALKRTEASGLVVLSQNARIGRVHETETLERLYYAQFERVVTRPESSGTVTDDTSALSANHQWIVRRLDHLLLPTRGWGLSAELGGGRSFHTDADSGFFGRATGRVTGYWPLGASFHGQARLQLGQVFADPSVSVPYTQLFRAGGDDSVRGYGNQALGPTNTAGTAIGGHVVATASLEVARPISRDLPAFWWATFVDAGNAAARWGQLDPAVGYGVGLRWRSPVGPLRIDWAYGTQARRGRLHFTVGLTF